MVCLSVRLKTPAEGWSVNGINHCSRKCKWQEPFAPQKARDGLEVSAKLKLSAGNCLLVKPETFVLWWVFGAVTSGSLEYETCFTAAEVWVLCLAVVGRRCLKGRFLWTTDTGSHQLLAHSWSTSSACPPYLGWNVGWVVDLRWDSCAVAVSLVDCGLRERTRSRLVCVTHYCA